MEIQRIIRACEQSFYHGNMNEAINMAFSSLEMLRNIPSNDFSVNAFCKLNVLILAAYLKREDVQNTDELAVLMHCYESAITEDCRMATMLLKKFVSLVSFFILLLLLLLLLLLMLLLSFSSHILSEIVAETKLYHHE